ncbi:MAG: lysine--tRNA ligase [Deltaproteobacteria bacterium RBG_13_61_14]|nr:MAG: lysine--tRNA ligase [Deltaproteobacteria bacterium RBG_13_61_14]
MSDPVAWPFQEAKKIKPGSAGEAFGRELSRTGAGAPPVIFQAGFGPSGLPHIGTFAEVVRTTFVLQAFEHLTGRQGVLYAFCDDMDGLRRVPKNLPRPDLLEQHLGRPISQIPDPFGCCDSYAGHMEKKLQEMLDAYQLPYQLKSSTEEYRRGVFNEGLRLILQKVEQVKAVILPTLKEENREDWSPFFPVCPKCGRLYTTRVTAYHPERDSLSYVCDGVFGEPPVKGCGHQAEVSVLFGNAKVGWKMDWALRWLSYGVGYEMFGKDLIDSAKLSGKLVRLLGGEAPAGMSYEMFLSEDGKKISKSVGEGLAVEDWLRYAPLESMLYYLYQNPKKQRRLYFDVIPKSVDDYLVELARYPSLEEGPSQSSVIWHLAKLKGETPAYTGAINYSLVLNLIQGIGADDAKLLYGYLLRYDPQAAENRELVESLISAGLHYFRDFIEPDKKYRQPQGNEALLLATLFQLLKNYSGDNAEVMQAMVFLIAQVFKIKPSELFKVIYQVLLGQDQGPRFGTFAKLIGKDRLAEMIIRVPKVREEVARVPLVIEEIKKFIEESPPEKMLDLQKIKV